MIHTPSPQQPTRPLSRRRFARLSAVLGATIMIGSARADSPAIVPRDPIALFNGKDLSGFYTWLGLPGPVDPTKTIHGRNDPDRVFTVVDQIDGAPALRISGQHWGGLITNERYANYRLVAEFRWGNGTGSKRSAVAGISHYS